MLQNWITIPANGFCRVINFKGKFVRYDNPNEFIQINDGRFDLNLSTINVHVFP